MRKRIHKNYLGRNFKKIRSDDVISAERRSGVMAKVKSKNTKFEETFIQALAEAIPDKFSTHVKAIRGNPDIVFQEAKLCVFLDSDFWHGWQYPRWKHLLKNDFWRAKIENNRKRDRRVTQYLRRKGWTVMRFWGHQLDNESKKIINRITDFINR